MRRIERKLFRLGDQLKRLAEERRVVEAELEALRHIDDDAQRDAVLGLERLEATATRNDVNRFERALTDLDERIANLESRRRRLLVHGFSANE
ncbi:MAG TPA: hypothetical protein VM470_07760 [Acidimicrobiia bacterium]|nr:hypothetical protein [Acidimicrobiia bacterium]